jgi:hypothetical protein
MTVDLLRPSFPLTDGFGRQATDLRVSLTDKCGPTGGVLVRACQSAIASDTKAALALAYHTRAYAFYSADHFVSYRESVVAGQEQRRSCP